MVKFSLVLGLFLFYSYNNVHRKYMDPCEEAKASAEAATALSKTYIYDVALKEIQTAFLHDGKEHVVAFGKDSNNNVIISNAFADLHNHPVNHPPDAGDLYGLIDICQKNKDYNTRFIVTQNKTVYALVITNTAAADTFDIKYPPDLSGCSGCSPKFPEAIVDEFREIKYAHVSTDEMALAFILAFPLHPTPPQHQTCFVTSLHSNQPCYCPKGSLLDEHPADHGKPYPAFPTQNHHW